MEEGSKPRFEDVKDTDWFAPYVEVCVEEGLMQGTGDGKFEPQRELTITEAMVLTARLHATLAGERESPLIPFLTTPMIWYKFMTRQGPKWEISVTFRSL